MEMESSHTTDLPILVPPPLKKGDKVRFVSPASPPDQATIEARAKILKAWGLEVEIAPNAFEKHHYFAGTDEQRLSDFNDAIRDPSVRAIFATRGGKGSYRIAPDLDFDAMRADPKHFIGFSDNTAIHLNLWKHCQMTSIYGSILNKPTGEFIPANIESLKNCLLSSNDICIPADPNQSTAELTRPGKADGILLGGNLNLISTSAGWALPSLKGKILLLEAIGMYVGEVDRQLTMLRRSGSLDGLNGLALGQFTDFNPSAGLTIIELLRHHLAQLDIPILGGLPLGHEATALSVPIGLHATLDTSANTLSISNRA